MQNKAAYDNHDRELRQAKQITLRLSFVLDFVIKNR